MSGYEVARLDEIVELDDGRIPFRPVRHHFGITSFGITAWTAREAGKRMINEHDEDDDGSGTNEELYLVTAGRARFELDGDSVDAPAGTFVFARGAVTRTAFAEEAGTTIVAMAMGRIVRVTSSRDGGASWTPFSVAYDAGEDAPPGARLPTDLLALGRRVLLYAPPGRVGETYPLLYSDDQGASWHGR